MVVENMLGSVVNVYFYLGRSFLRSSGCMPPGGNLGGDVSQELKFKSCSCCCSDLISGLIPPALWTKTCADHQVTTPGELQ